MVNQQVGFLLFTRRLSNPHRIRWLTPDPIGFKDGLNLYAYVHNNPLRYVDPNGKFAFAIPLHFGAFGIGGFTVALPSTTILTYLQH